MANAPLQPGRAYWYQAAPDGRVTLVDMKTGERIEYASEIDCFAAISDLKKHIPQPVLH